MYCFSQFLPQLVTDLFNESDEQQQDERRVYQEVFSFAQGAMETYMAKQKVSQKSLRLFQKI